MDQLLHRAKRRQALKVIIISSITVIIVALAGVFGISRMTTHQAGALYHDLDVYHTLKEPNVQVASELLNGNTLVGGAIVTQEYKNLDGYIVKWQRLSSSYTSLRHQLDQTLTATGSIQTADSSQAVNADSGQKVALFYTTTKKLPNEAAALPNGQVGEVAVTFKHPYTYAELRHVLPKNVNLTWGFVFSEATQETGAVARQADPVGIDLSAGLSLKYWQSALREYHPNQAASAKAKALRASKKTLKFAGVMVTGRSEALRQLAHAKGIAGTSVGATTQRVAYIHPKR